MGANRAFSGGLEEGSDMSDLGFNKIAGSVLATGLALIGLNEASHAFFHEAHYEKDGYHIEVPEVHAGSDANVVEEGPRDYFVLISNASAEAGKEVANKCTQCHKFEPGAESTGPSLYGIIGKRIAAEPNFKYTTGPGSMTAYAEEHGTWTYEAFDHYIENPKKAAPGTAMNFIGLRRESERANIMAYLRTLTSGEPVPLPDPLPPPAPVEAAAPTDASAPSDAATTAAPAPAQPAPH
jgi:cytochrome c